jgi:DNA-binding transcriptional LysR family regulator
VFRATEPEALEEAVIAGIGIGYVSPWTLARHPGLVEVLPRNADWESKLWLVTHVDLHRTSKVQSFVSFLKAEAKAW